MITRLSHATIFVLDQDKAFDFYVNKLGFKVHTDVTMENGFRWLTVTAPDQPDLEIVLMPVLDSTMNGFDAESIQAIRTLLKKDLMGANAWYTPDCRATYEELKAKGVNCTEPKEQFYGTESIIKDGCGNWFSMTEPKEGF
jgi:catechol 2,3-dioxygenase-like lactoylglutathione lyase family enzyme